MHPVAFFLESFTQTERNYNIYDRELLAVVKALRTWRTYLVGSPHIITIHTDHANLIYWKEPRKISRRVAREFQELQEYNFVLKHVSGTKNVRADALSRRSDYDEGEEDNGDVTVLPEELFVNLAGTEDKSIEELSMWSELNHHYDPKPEWINAHNLYQDDVEMWCHEGARVANVEGNIELKRGVISLFHDPPHRGHPGIANTHALLKERYWWPRQKEDVEEYVKGCATCQANKINTHRQKPRLFPITTDPEVQPFEVVTMDFITKLPVSKGFDTILTITDHDCTKAAIFIPCNEMITAEGVAQLYLQHVYPHYGLPKKMITDRDPRFILTYMRNLCRTLDIKQNVSSAYHPQTDGQSERMNQLS